MSKEEKFEEKLIKLEEIVKELEMGNVDLDDALNKYKEAMQIVKVCATKLSNVETEVNKILTETGELKTYDVDIDDAEAF